MLSVSRVIATPTVRSVAVTSSSYVDVRASAYAPTIGVAILEHPRYIDVALLSEELIFTIDSAKVENVAVTDNVVSVLN